MEKLTLPEFIKHYVSNDFNAKYAHKIAEDMIEVMTGNRAGNAFEITYSKVIYATYNKDK